MKVNFLSARKPLTKTISATGETLKSYPLVKNFTSHSGIVSNIEQFHDFLVYHSRLKHCFLKGELIREIKDEPRAGMTNSIAPTQLLCLDYDADDVVNSIDELLYEIHPELKETTHIIQYSARAGFSNKTKLRAHIFFMLDKPISPELLKTWVMDKNFRIEVLREQIGLSANSMALTYPLDVTVNQNDKLIFIAPPEMEDGAKDPIANRIVLVKRQNPTITLKFPPSMEVINEEKLKILNDLRQSMGLPKRKPSIKILSGEEILTNPGTVLITGQKKERGFIYLNMNGGDSWGYFFSERNPSIVRNFKGEPYFYLKDVAPELYKEYTKVTNGNLPGLPLVFRDRASDKYFNALIDQNNDEVVFMDQAASKERLHDFLAQYGVDAPAFIEDYTIEFDPQSSTQFDLSKRWINIFKSTKYLAIEKVSDVMPTTIAKVLRHLCVDEETYNHFINWLAYIFQYRDRSETAWVFQGTQGTGKGWMFNKLLRTIFGPKYTQPITLTTLMDNFNDYIEAKLIIYVDEIDVDHVGNETSQGKLMNRLKNMITEPTLPMRKMYKGVSDTRSYVNLIFSSNDVASLYIPDNDRRFNIAPRQETPLKEVMDVKELDYAMKYELDAFAAYLKGYAVNVDKAKEDLNNTAKAEFVSDGKNSVQQFFLSYINGEIEYFESAFYKDPNVADFDPVKAEARKYVQQWKQDAINGRVSKTPSVILAKVYYAMQGGLVSMNKFGRICTKNGMKAKLFKLHGTAVRGFTTQFFLPQGYELIEEEEEPEETPQKITPIQRKKEA